MKIKKIFIDIDNIKRQLLADQEKYLEEQKQTRINNNENNSNDKRN